MTASVWAKTAKRGVALRPRDNNDFYPTSPEHIRLALSRYADLNPQWVLDIGAGEGVWGIEARKLWDDAQIWGIESRMNMIRKNAYNRLILTDFLKLNTSRPSFDFIMSNPPYSLSEAIIRKAFSLLMPDAPMVMLFRLQFLASVRRFLFWTVDFPPVEVMVCSDRPSFTGDGKTDSDDYMLVHWIKGYRGETKLSWGIASELKQPNLRQKALF